MRKTNAQYQAEWRARQRRWLEDALAENALLRNRVAELESMLGAGSASVASQCRHPAEAVENGQCRACGDWL